MTLPLVSCICPTFSRPDLLCEAIQSFLLQDYEGQKELIIVNDFDEQVLQFEHPEIKIFNYNKRIHTLGEKRNEGVNNSSGEIIFPWDDDDIHLPNRISQSVNHLAENDVEYYKPTTAFFWNYGKITELSSNSFHAQCCHTRTLFSKIGGYTAMNSGEDIDFDNKVRKVIGSNITTLISPEDNYYFYRWGGTDSHHISTTDTSDMDSLKKVYLMNKTLAKLKRIKTGKITLSPYWKHDYIEQKNTFLVP